MGQHRTLTRLGAATAFTSCLAILAFAGTASASTTLTFKEPAKGSTFAFIDRAPKKKLSAGDEVLFTNPLEAEGKIVGKIRAVCTASATSEDVVAAGFICTALAKIPGGTLVLVVPLSEGDTGPEGAVTGGTGKYAGAHGTFIIKQGRSSSTNTITLLE